MTSFINYIYNFARETWLRGFVNSKSKEDIADIPDRFRDFPKVEKEYCIACGSCTASCPSPNAIKLLYKCKGKDGIILIKLDMFLYSN